MNNERNLVLNRPVEYIEAPPFPRNMMITPVSFCNHQCVMCAYRKSAKRSVSIDMNLLTDIMKQAHCLGTSEIGFYGTCEPFMWRELEEGVRRAKEIGYTYIYVTTNGVLATEKRLLRLYEAGLDSLKFSINAADRETYKEIHGKDDFDRAIQAVKTASRLRDNGFEHVRLFASCVESGINQGHHKRLEPLLSPYIDKSYCAKACNQGGHMYDELKRGIVEKNKITNGLCEQIFNRINITPEGYLSACCGDFNNELILADLNRIALKDAWNGKTATAFRRLHLARKLPRGCMCYNCMNNENFEVIPLDFAAGQC